MFTESFAFSLENFAGDSTRRFTSDFLVLHVCTRGHIVLLGGDFRVQDVSIVRVLTISRYLPFRFTGLRILPPF